MPLPEDPHQRAVIAVLSRDEANAARYDPEHGETLLDDEIAIAEYPPVDGDAIAERLRDQRVLRPGELLIQSPFDPDVYVPVRSAAETFAQDKYAVFLEVCQELGATRAEVTRVDAKTASGKASAEVSGGNPTITGTASAARETVEEFTRELSWVRTFPGGEPNIEAAEQILRDHQLMGDRPLRSLIRGRGNSTNPIQEDTLSVNLTDETQAKLNVAARVKLPVAKMGAKWSRVSDEKVSVKVTLHVVF